MRRSRTLYFNDARHYYLFVHEPPISLENAWRPIDDVAGTAVDTFVYGVARVDGLYYPSRVGTQFRHGEHGPDSPGFQQSAYWRTWHNMKSLEKRGLDPLRLLVDRARAPRLRDLRVSHRDFGFDGIGRSRGVRQRVRDFGLGN